MILPPTLGYPRGCGIKHGGPKWRYGAPFEMAENIFGFPWDEISPRNKWSYLTLPKTTRGPPRIPKVQRNHPIFWGFQGRKSWCLRFLRKGGKRVKAESLFLAQEDGCVLCVSCFFMPKEMAFQNTQVIVQKKKSWLMKIQRPKNGSNDILLKFT